MRREDLDVRHVGGVFAVVFVLLGGVDLLLDGRIGVGDVVLNLVAAVAVAVATLFPTFRMPGRRRGEGFTVPALVAALLAGVLVGAALLV